MQHSLLQHARDQMTDIRQVTKSRRWKMIYAFGFLTGFVIFAILGEKLVTESGLLDVDSLRKVRDTILDDAAFLQYVFRRRILWLLAGILAWWWGFGKWYIYGILGGYGFVMGACLQTAIMRYSIKGIMLCVFLYFPQVIFYAGTIFCAIILADTIPARIVAKWPALQNSSLSDGVSGHGVHRTGAEKFRALMQKGLILLWMLGLYAVGIYCEGRWNVMLLQKYLQFF